MKAPVSSRPADTKQERRLFGDDGSRRVSVDGHQPPERGEFLQLWSCAAAPWHCSVSEQSVQPRRGIKAPYGCSHQALWRSAAEHSFRWWHHWFCNILSCLQAGDKEQESFSQLEFVWCELSQCPIKPLWTTVLLMKTSFMVPDCH